MASTINAQTTPFAAVVTTADDTGNLALQTANVTAVTIDTNQNVTFANVVTATTLVGSANASSLSTGTVSTARLATGTANSSTYLRGDSTWAALSAPNNGTLTMGVSGTGLSGSATFTADQSGNSTFTVTSNATNANTAGAIVARDGSGNFSAGTITAALSGTATTATNASNLTGGNITGNMIVANATSPNSYYLQFGDNTGWVYRFMTNVSGTPTTRFSFQDNGAFTAVNNITAYSDERLKKNWRPVQEGFVEKLAQVKSGVYDRTDIEATQAGASAQDMQKLLPEVVQDGEHLSLAYGNAALVAAIELAKQVVELKKEIELLKGK